MAMDLDTHAQKEETGRKDMEDGDEISTGFLKEGTASEEDIRCIIRDIREDPEEVKTLLEILGIEDEQLVQEVGNDEIDGAPISSHILKKLTEVTYVGLTAALDDRSLKRRDLVAKHCLINKDLIPTCILARGRKALAAYRRALKNGKTYDNRVKVILAGPDRAGKTSLAKALRGEALNNDEPSTDGVHISEPLKNASEKPWRYSIRRSSEYEDRCVEMMSRDLLEGSRGELAEEATEDATENVAVKPAVNQNAIEGKQPDPVHVDGNCMTSLHATERNEMGAVPDGIASLLEEKLEHDEVDTSDGIWPVIWELAGQAVDRALHPIFMTSEGMYLLVFDLSKDVFAKTAKCNDSSLDNIMRCMDTVHSLKQSIDGETFPPAILVGTHADCVKPDDPEKKKEYLSDRFCQNPLIDEHVAGYFAVDNTQAGRAPEKEDPEVALLRQKILDVAETMPHTKKEIPLHWLYIESKIEEKARSGEKYVSKKTFQEDIVDKACTIEEGDDIEEILQFLHDRGTVVYHDLPNNPDGLVVLNPQWLVNVIRQILNVVPSREESMRVRKCRKQLQDKGLLAAELLDHACKTLRVHEIKQSLIFIMEKFNLLCRCHSKEHQPVYLVPCMLKAIPEEEVMVPEEEVMVPEASEVGSSPALYLTFKTNYVPMGLFPKLVALFGAWAASKSSCEQQQIFSNTACFILDDKNFLRLICHKSVIKLNVWSQDDSYGDSGCHSEVCSYLERCLAIIRDECQWLRSVTWVLSIQCTLCAGQADPKTGLCIWHDTKGCLHDDCAHYIHLMTHPYFCPYAKGSNNVIPEDDFEDWFGAVENNNIQQETIPTAQSTLLPCKQDKSKVQVTLLAGEWGSSKGGLPTVNRLLAKELAKHPKLEVSLYVLKCSEEDERMANNHGITIVKAEQRPGYEPLDWLGFRPPEGFRIDVVIGHGMKLGKQAQLIRQFFPKCAWIQFEHTAPEELAMYKNYSRNISRGEEKYETEVQLSAMADLVVAVGPKLAEVFRTYLRPYPKKRVFEIVPTPSIFQEFKNCEQVKKDGEKFNVLVFGRGDEEDFELKGYDIAPKAIAELKDHRYHLYFVGAAKGEMEKVTKRLLKHGISESQLTVRGFIESREKLAKQMCEVDLAIMPSRTEGFGLTALEALSAGLPILVGANSGFAEALKKLETPAALTCVVDSNNGKDWAAAIQAVKETSRSQRLQDAQRLKASFEKAFNWPKRCRRLAQEVLALVREQETGKQAFPDSRDGSDEMLNQSPSSDSQNEEDCNQLQNVRENDSKHVLGDKVAAESSGLFNEREDGLQCAGQDLRQKQQGSLFPERSEWKEEESTTAIRRRTGEREQIHYTETVKREGKEEARKRNARLKITVVVAVLFFVVYFAIF